MCWENGLACLECNTDDMLTFFPYLEPKGLCVFTRTVWRSFMHEEPNCPSETHTNLVQWVTRSSHLPGRSFCFFSHSALVVVFPLRAAGPREKLNSLGEGRLDALWKMTKAKLKWSTIRQNGSKPIYKWGVFGWHAWLPGGKYHQNRACQNCILKNYRNFTEECTFQCGLMASPTFPWTRQTLSAL